MQKNEQSEADFLANYSIEKFDRPSITTDIVAFMIRSEKTESYRLDCEKKLSILLIKRGEHPYKGHWALPGGFLKKSETVEECALREITEEAGITPASLMPIGVFSRPNRDPRGWIISNAFTSILSEDIALNAGDDAEAVKWFDISLDEIESNEYCLTLSCEDKKIETILTISDSKLRSATFEIKGESELAFDHAQIIATALNALRKSAKSYDIIFDFLPEKFTLTALQKVQEIIMNKSILPANFRRKISDYVIETDEFTQGQGHRPAKLFRRKSL